MIEIHEAAVAVEVAEVFGAVEEAVVIVEVFEEAEGAVATVEVSEEAEEVVVDEVRNTAVHF